MAQVLFTDKIGTLSHSAGTITLTSSRLTIGGQQYINSTALSRLITADVTLVANSLYMIYAVRNAGNTELRISSNVNSVGPAGFISWKLVGAFYANGLTGSIAFGSFINIEGVPQSNQWSFTPTGSWNTNTTYGGQLERRGDRLVYIGNLSLSGAPNAVQLFWNMPTNLVLDTSKTSPNFGAVGNATAQDSGNNSYMTPIQLLSGLIYPYTAAVPGVGVQSNVPFTFGAADSCTVEVEVPVVGWNNTPLKDL